MAREFIETSFMDGYAGGPHITEKQVGIANQGTYGEGDYVLETGRKAEAQVLTNNSIRIFDAVFVIQGRRDVIAANDYEDVSISNGAQGMNRNDIIVRRYEKDESTEVEKTSYAVIKGTANAGAAVDPEVTSGDIRSGATLHEMPLYRVKIEGLNIVEVEPLFKVLMNMSTINKYLSDLSSEKINNYKFGPIFPATKTGEYLNSAPIYTKMIDVGALPNNSSKSVSTGISNANYIWIDTGNSLAFKGGGTYPIPHVDPSNSKNSISCRITGGGATIIITTGTNWDGYSALVTVKYTKK